MPFNRFPMNSTISHWNRGRVRNRSVTESERAQRDATPQSFAGVACQGE